MESKPQLSTQVINNEEEARVDDDGEDEEFYEKIEAPKFVDLTAPDRCRPDDRYWFCLRVGCDQKHEEELDPEAISKNFILRVMAARSPNIRLRKALNRKASSMNEKCPLSAPAKTTKSRISRLTVISSISQTMVDDKVKVKPLSKISSTPKAKAKQVAAKYLTTTPKNKKCLPNRNSFRSVQNPKPTSIAVPKSRVVAKALVFHSPKKGFGIKTSAELRTPLTKICEGMKRLEITSQRKRVLGYSNKSSKEIRCDPNKSFPVNPSRRQLNASKDKSKAKEVFRPPNCKDKETKSSRHMKRNSKGSAKRSCNSILKKMVKNDSSDTEIDMKSREGSVLVSSRITEISSSDDTIQEECIPCSEAAPSTKNDVSNSEEECLEENDFSKFQALNQEGDGSSEGIDQEEKKAKASSEKRGSPKDCQTESQTLERVGHEDEAVDSDDNDKENALASDGNRDFDNNKNHSGREVLGKQETDAITKKVARTQDKNLKGLTVAGADAQGVKYKKPKPTNPKPFRLRTDERGILKEANLEKRIQSLVPQKETSTLPMLPGGILQKKHGNDTLESSGKDSEKNFQKKQSRIAGLRTSEGQVRPKIVTLNRRSDLTQQKPKPITSRRESENSLRKTKSSPLQGKFISPKGVASTRKAMASYLTCGKQLSVIKEASVTALRSEDTGEPSHIDAGLINKATTTPSRSSSRGKKAATIPKEPNFHSIHTPKSCTRKVA